ncbi:MAG: transketolase C-terminal domain-containing protein, partial [Actinomycetota bacterium]
RLIDAPVDDRPGVTIVTTGPMAPESVAAAAELDAEGVAATVVHLTSPGRVYRSARSAYTSVVDGAVVRRPSHLHRLVPAGERDRPVVSVHDAASHSLSWIGSALGTRQLSLGVDRFGESGTIADLHEVTGISAGDIVNAALVAITE